MTKTDKRIEGPWTLREYEQAYEIRFFGDRTGIVIPHLEGATNVVNWLNASLAMFVS